MAHDLIKDSSINKISIFQITIICFLGLIIGAACSVFSGVIVFGVVAAIICLFFMIKRPEIAIIAILVATSSILFEDQLPLLSAGGISLHIPDILLIGLIGLIVVRWLIEPKFKIVRTPLNSLLIFFYAATLISTIIAIYGSTASVEMARRMIRIMTYYLTFFVVINLVRERRQLKFLLLGSFFLSILVAVVMVAQYLVGSSLTLLPGRVEILNTQGINYNDVTRILPPGLAIVFVAFVTLFCVLLVEKNSKIVWVKLIEFGFLGMAILFTFLRSYWAVIIIVFSLLFIILRGHERLKLFIWGAGLLGMTGMVVILVFNIQNSKVEGLFTASIERVTTLFDVETYQGKDSSLNWRNIENRYAMQQIIAHPYLGSGMGAMYRPYDPRLDKPGEDLRYFIHNGHLRILLDSGIIGYLSFIVLSIVFIIRGLVNWRSVENERLKGVMLGFTLVYLAILIAAAVNSIFTNWNWAPVIGIMMGTNEVIYLRFKQED